jgi:hypothetical protein
MSEFGPIFDREAFIETCRAPVQSARDENKDAYARLAAEVDPLLERIVASTPATPRGIRAKARATVLSRGGPEADFPSEDETTAIVRSLLTDLVAMPGDSSGSTLPGPAEDRKTAGPAVRVAAGVASTH